MGCEPRLRAQNASMTQPSLSRNRTHLLGKPWRFVTPLAVPSAIALALVSAATFAWLVLTGVYSYDAELRGYFSQSGLNPLVGYGMLAAAYAIPLAILAVAGSGNGALWWAGCIAWAVADSAGGRAPAVLLFGCACWAVMTFSYAWRAWRTKSLFSSLWLFSSMIVLGYAATRWPGAKLAHLGASETVIAARVLFLALLPSAVIILAFRAIWQLSGKHAPGVDASALPVTAAHSSKSGPVSSSSSAEVADARDAKHEAIAKQRAAIAASRQPPKENFAGVDGYEQEKTALRRCISAVLARDGEAGLGAVLYGPPGNGKSLLAVSVAGELGVPVLRLNYATVNSQWIGTTSNNIFETLDEAFRYPAGVVVVMDEVDALWKSRTAYEGSGGQDEYLRIINGFLERFDRMRGAGIAVVATTNRIDALDPALVRAGRFNLKLEIANPDRDTRRRLVQRLIEPLEIAPDPRVLDWFVGFSSGFSTAKVRNVVASAIRLDARFGARALLATLREDSGASKPAAEDCNSLADLQLTGSAARFVEEVLPALRDPFAFACAGGLQPQGALFCGPPGTGKTALARSLALAADCSLVVTGGAALAASPAKVREVIATAVQQKPSILFVDEAEPLLQRRDGWGPQSGAITQFLELTGSSAADLQGVLLIAATNLPEIIDPAALRGGRFGRRIDFELPSAEALRARLSKLLAGAPMAHAIDVEAAAQSLATAGRSLADLEARFSTARSRAAARAIERNEAAVLQADDLDG